ncbi:MarR family winged helix-turn-helix transcriptional regulator [Tractidigestivibacter sp.]|jgi:MarR family transcriptional repressor of mepA|uniref:MarR family winged helix-turn-helix transcriptional regulator n=1 Tax=Tractidigestivibacter sp. TaxID=2847320 RepID=UPI003D91ED98
MESQSSECGMLIKQINDRVSRLFNNQVRDADLTLSQIRYLTFLYEHGGSLVPFREIQEHFGVSQPTVTGILKRLMVKRLVFSETGAEGGRSKSYGLTQKGVMQLKSAEAARNAQEEQLLSPLSEAERAAFQDMLTRILDNLRE